MYQIDELTFNKERNCYWQFEPVCTCDNLQEVYCVLCELEGVTTRVLSNDCVLCFVNGEMHQIEWFRKTYIDNSLKM